MLTKKTLIKKFYILLLNESFNNTYFTSNKNNILRESIDRKLKSKPYKFYKNNFLLFEKVNLKYTDFLDEIQKVKNDKKTINEFIFLKQKELKKKFKLLIETDFIDKQIENFIKNLNDKNIQEELSKKFFDPHNSELQNEFLNKFPLIKEKEFVVKNAHVYFPLFNNTNFKEFAWKQYINTEKNNMVSLEDAKKQKDDGELESLIKEFEIKYNTFLNEHKQKKEPSTLRRILPFLLPGLSWLALHFLPASEKKEINIPVIEQPSQTQETGDELNSSILNLKDDFKKYEENPTNYFSSLNPSSVIELKGEVSDLYKGYKTLQQEVGDDTAAQFFDDSIILKGIDPEEFNNFIKTVNALPSDKSSSTSPIPKTAEKNIHKGTQQLKNYLEKFLKKEGTNEKIEFKKKSALRMVLGDGDKDKNYERIYKELEDLLKDAEKEFNELVKNGISKNEEGTLYDLIAQIKGVEEALKDTDKLYAEILFKAIKNAGEENTYGANDPTAASSLTNIIKLFKPEKVVEIIELSLENKKEREIKKFVNGLSSYKLVLPIKTFKNPNEVVSEEEFGEYFKAIKKAQQAKKEKPPASIEDAPYTADSPKFDPQIAISYEIPKDVMLISFSSLLYLNHIKEQSDKTEKTEIEIIFKSLEKNYPREIKIIEKLKNLPITIEQTEGALQELTFLRTGKKAEAL